MSEAAACLSLIGGFSILQIDREIISEDEFGESAFTRYELGLVPKKCPVEGKGGPLPVKELLFDYGQGVDYYPLMVVWDLLGVRINCPLSAAPYLKKHE